MATELSKIQWSQILVNSELTNDADLSIFQTLYSFDDHKAYASQVGFLLGYKGKSPHAPLNLEIGRYAKRIAQRYDIQFTERSKRRYKYWDLFFKGWEEGKYFIWQLRPELSDALRECKLTGEQPYTDELPTEENISEGVKKTVTVNSYERNPKARSLCIKQWGCLCTVCNFNFQEIYGDIGSGFIHVHHLTPLSQIGDSYQIDPINDLRPVCPNCHSMLHTSNPPLSIEQLKEIISLRRYAEVRSASSDGYHGISDSIDNG